MDSELDYLPTNPNESSEFDDGQLDRSVHVYTDQQMQEINHYYEQNCANLRLVFNRPEVQKAIKGIIHLSDHIKKDEEDNNVSCILIFNFHSFANICSLLDHGRLEIYRYGSRSTLSLGVHLGSLLWHHLYHSSSALPLRPTHSN